MNNAASTPRELQRVIDSFSASKLEMAERCMQAFAFHQRIGRSGSDRVALTVAVVVLLTILAVLA